MANQTAERDGNNVPTLLAVSSADGVSTVAVYANPVTHRLLVDNAGSGGGITSINTDTTAAQTLTVGTTGTDFAIVDNGTGDHKFNLPTASASNRGALSSTDWSTFNGKGNGTVTAVSIATANGFSGSSSGGATPSLTIVAGAITPTSVNSIVLSGSATPTLAVTGTTTISGSNTGDQTSVSGNAGTATALQNARTIGGTSFNGTANIAIGALNSTNVGATTSAQFAGVISDETGSGALVFASSPTLVTPALGTPTALVLTSATGLPAAAVLAGTLGTGAYVMDTKLTVPQVLTTNNAITASGGAATIPITSKINTVTNNSAGTLTITITTTGAIDGQLVIVRILDFSAVAETLSWINVENSTVSVPALSNGSTTLPVTVGFQFNANTTKWRTIASA